MIKKVCYLDLDGVLVDFVGGVFKAHEERVKAANLKYETLDWDFDKKLGLTPEEFWNPLGYDFWLGLNWTKEGKDILTLIEKYFGENVVILTSPPRTSGSVQGKLDWIKREIPRYERKVMVGSCKHLMASRDKILVDDYQENIEKFTKAGGFAHMIARPWNSYRGQEDKNLEELELALKFGGKLNPVLLG